MNSEELRQAVADLRVLVEQGREQADALLAQLEHPAE